MGMIAMIRHEYDRMSMIIMAKHEYDRMSMGSHECDNHECDRMIIVLKGQSFEILFKCGRRNSLIFIIARFTSRIFSFIILRSYLFLESSRSNK